MNARFSRAAAALAALVLVLMLLNPVRPPVQSGAPPAASDALDRHGMSALSAWLRQSGFPVAALRKRLRDLELSHPGDGQVLILALPIHNPIRSDDSLALVRWLAQGNALLVLARHADAVTARGVEKDLRVLGEALGFKVRERDLKSTRKQRDDARKLLERRIDGNDPSEQTISLNVSSGHPMFARVGQINVKALKPMVLLDRLSLSSSTAAIARVLEHPDYGQLGWYWRTDDASALILGLGGLGSNSNLARADNALALSNALHFLGQAGKSVIFADYYQGRSDLYDPAALLKDQRLHQSLLILLALWLAYLLLVERRLLPAQRERKAPPTHELKSLARLLGRHTPHSQRAHALLDGRFVRAITRSGDLNDAIAVLSRDSRVDRADLERIKRAHSDPATTDADLENLLAAILRIEHARRRDPA